MLIIIADVLAALIGLGIIFIGVREFVAPQASVDFGIPGTQAQDPTFRAWLSIKAVRDIASGVFIFILLIGASHHLMGWFMLAAAGIPLGDCLVVLRNNG